MSRKVEYEVYRAQFLAAVNEAIRERQDDEKHPAATAERADLLSEITAKMLVEGNAHSNGLRRAYSINAPVTNAADEYLDAILGPRVMTLDDLLNVIMEQSPQHRYMN